MIPFECNRPVLLEDCTLALTQLDREQQLDHLANLALLGVGRVELKPGPDLAVLVEECAELGLTAVVCLANAAALEETLMPGLEVRVSPALLPTARERQLPCWLVLSGAGQISPAALARELTRARDHQVLGVCMQDELGVATPDGVFRLGAFCRNAQEALGMQIEILWSQRDTEGTGIYGALQALRSGLSGVRCAGLGLGGMIALDTLLLNLVLEGLWSGPTEALKTCCAHLVESLDLRLPANYPLAGRDAFCTSTGVHARAMQKALQMGQPALADQVYSVVAPGRFGFSHRIEVGPLSGRSNVECWLMERGLSASPKTVGRILERAKAHYRSLDDQEILALLEDRS
ncbi:MAG: hypothetical protein AMXMBFR33_18450 [Candidatus Xenobia bacterium]